MICQNCNKREASIQLNVQTNNQKSQYRLCHTCYQALMNEHKIPSGFGGGGFMNIDDLFSIFMWALRDRVIRQLAGDDALYWRRREFGYRSECPCNPFGR